MEYKETLVAEMTNREVGTEMLIIKQVLQNNKAYTKKVCTPVVIVISIIVEMGLVEMFVYGST